MPARPTPNFSASPPVWLKELGWGERYLPKEIIGSGGMGQVWRAEERASGRTLALKVIDPTRTGDEHLLARLETEALALRCLLNAGQHPNIVPVLDFKVTDTHACLVMEYIPGQDLRTWCDTFNLDLRGRVRLLAKAARAAGWCHQHDIIHRDLKPANILVHTQTGEPVVVDFSIAKTSDPLELTLTHEALGTTPYMAPEQLDHNRGPISPAADVYALGATLYELITHVLPHPGNLAQVIRRHQNEVQPARPSLLNKEVSRNLECICLKALACRADDRYPNGDELADDLERFLSGHPVQARPLSRFLNFRRQAQRSPGLTAALVACIVVSILAAWSVHRVNVERFQRKLEGAITAAMHAKVWSRSELKRADGLLARLAPVSPESAATLQATMEADVINDVQTTLQQPYLKPSDLDWMNDVCSTWLTARNRDTAQRLQSLIGERISRWEPVVTARAPFDKIGDLFPHSKMWVQGDLLYPSQEFASGSHAKDAPVSIMIKEGLAAPVEASVTFGAAPDSFKFVALDFEFNKVRTVIVLCRVRHAAKSVRLLTAGQNLDPEGLMLYAVRAKAPYQPVYIPDRKLLNSPFKLTARVERNQLNVDLNGIWSLAVNDIFTLAFTGPNNWFRIAWPPGLGLEDVTLRSRMAGEPSPLEQGDLQYSLGQWSEAQRLYERLKGDPAVGDEASYKASMAMLKQHQLDTARAEWERLSQTPPSIWRDLSNYRLWALTVERHNTDEARPYLRSLPNAESLSPTLAGSISVGARQSLIDSYRRVGQGTNTLRTNADAISDAVKTFDILGVARVETAASLALALHFSGLDSAARNLLKEGLGNPASAIDRTVDQHSAVFALNHWTFLARNEDDKPLRLILKAWRSSFPDNAEIQALGDQEDARTLARSNLLTRALHSVQRVHERTEVDARQLTLNGLLEGMIQHDLGMASESQASWRSGIAAADKVIHRSPMHLCDMVVLHTLTRSWNRESCTRLLPRLITRGSTGENALSLEAAFVSNVLAASEIVTALNSLATDPRCLELAHHYAYRTRSPRELVRRWSTLVLEHYFLTCAFDPPPSAEIAAYVRETAETLVEALSTSSGNESEFFEALRIWSTMTGDTPGLASPLAHVGPLAAKLKWLSAQRCLRSGLLNDATRLLKSIQHESSLDKHWQSLITAQLEGQ